MRYVMRIRRIHHLTIAVRDVELARTTFEALFDCEAAEQRVLDAFGVRTRDVPIGDDVLQLAAPLGNASPIMRFIERKGEGFYNLALEVDDLDAAVSELAARGIKVSEPIVAQPGVRSSFVTMAATHGLSIQLVQALDGADQSLVEEFESDGDVREEAPPTPIDAAAGAPLDLTPDEWSDLD
jgi:methylmalonyl-CoA epimerase